MQREHAVELLRAREIRGKLPARTGEGGIADRADRAEPVGGAALDDEHEAAVGVGLGERHARRERERGGAGARKQERTAVDT